MDELFLHQICRNVALHHLLTKYPRSEWVRQNESRTADKNLTIQSISNVIEAKSCVF